MMNNAMVTIKLEIINMVLNEQLKKHISSIKYSYLKKIKILILNLI